MTGELRFDDRVAIVTGAGGGLGRAHALMLAARGAKVVVNDLGGSHTGEGASGKVADQVVKEILDRGGVAVANTDSVEDGAQIVATAIEAFGRVDIVINNAGILRDVSFHKMTDTDWDLIYRVHVLGSYKVTHAAWPYMREQGYGRIIMTASAAGIYGNFGQANYSMAKLGLAGFANTLAIEGRRKGICVNTIAPLAGSRMTETILPSALIEALRPEYVSPLVGWLCHQDCDQTGGLFEVGGGFVAQLRWERSAGKLFRIGRNVGPEEIRRDWDVIAGFDDATHPDNVIEAMSPIMKNAEAGPSKGGNEFIDVDLALGYQFPPQRSSYTEHDLALYALGVGAAADASDDRDLQLVYEMHGTGMKALPTFAVIPALGVMMAMAKDGIAAPGLNYGLERLLHGEQYTELSGPLPLAATLTHQARIKDIFDKGKHALVVTEVISCDSEGRELIRNEFTSLIRGAGGWGGDRGPSSDTGVPPERNPDIEISETIPRNQALLYRLTGDWNPLHVDPNVANAFGFDRPILHGLCTFGFAARQVVRNFAKDGDPRYFKSIRARFADSVFPGETLTTTMWKVSEQQVIFQCRVKERDSVVISNAMVEFFTEIPQPAAQEATPREDVGDSHSVSTPTLTSADVFAAIGVFIGEAPQMAAKIKTVYQFKLRDPDTTWTVDLTTHNKVLKGEPYAAQCTLELSDGDFMDMCMGTIDSMKLFTSGRLKISGDIMASQKLDFLAKIPPEMVLSEAQKREGAGNSSPANHAEPTSWDVFVAIRDHIERHPELVDNVSASYLFKLSSPDSMWTVDVKTGQGAVVEGSVGTIDCTLEISEDDFLSMTRGNSDPMKLFAAGKLKISGDIMASQKLDFLQHIDPAEAAQAVSMARAAGQGPREHAPAVDAHEPNAPSIFAALAKQASDGVLSAELERTIVFRIVSPNNSAEVLSSWGVEFGGSEARIFEGEPTARAVATISLSDDDLSALVREQVSARELFQRGQMRIDGDVSVAHHLEFLYGLL